MRLFTSASTRESLLIALFLACWPIQSPGSPNSVRVVDSVAKFRKGVLKTPCHGSWIESSNANCGFTFRSEETASVPDSACRPLLATSDVISWAFENLVRWIDQLDPAMFGFVLKAILLFGLPVILCAYAFTRGNRSVPLQVLCATVGVLLAASLPVDRIVIRDPLAKTWVLALCLVLLTALPALLPRLLTPELGRQQLLRKIGYGLLALLLVANLLRMEGTLR